MERILARTSSLDTQSVVMSRRKDPWVCHTTPPLPWPRVASMVVRTASVTTKYWCGLAIRLTSSPPGRAKVT